MSNNSSLPARKPYQRSLDPELLQQLYGRLSQVERENKPQWFIEKRKIAFEVFQEQGIPAPRSEDWKYTNLRRLASVQFSLPEQKLTGEVRRIVDQSKRADCTNLVIVNGWYFDELSDTVENFPSVSFTNLAPVFSDSSHRLIPYLSGEEFKATQPLSALNFALMQDGIHLRIGRRVSVAKPIHLLMVSCQDGVPLISCPRVIIELEPESEVEIVETHIGHGQGLIWSNPVTELRIDDGAYASYRRFVETSGEIMHTGCTEVSVRQDARFDSLSFTRGGLIVRHDLDVSLIESGASTNLLGLYLNRASEHSDHHTTIDHAVADAKSEQLYKGILTDSGQATFNGRVIVRRNAQRTTAMQSNKNLLLSRTAEVNTKPQLEIDADDVKCSHGATVGQLNADEVFYLQSRGIDASHAKALLSQAFAQDLIDQVKSPTAKSILDNHLQRFFGEDS
jgi:Fe-S cluster assembly protein SufD